MTVMPEPAPDAPTIEQARAIAAAGIRVLPIKPGRKNPPMASWQNAASIEERTIASWWNGLYRDHGIGLAMGPQPDGRNLFAIDIDTHDEDANGYDTIAGLEAEHGELPATVTSTTGSGGQHLIFAAPRSAIIRNQQASGQRIGPGVDVRGDGGQIVVAPTIHPETRRPYRWAAGRAPWEHTIANAPTWLLELVTDKPTPPTSISLDARPPTITTSATSPAEILRERWHWPTELAATGWQEARRTPDGDVFYTRPGKDPRAGHSAVLHGTDGPFVVFTTEIPVELRTLGHATRDGSGFAFTPLEWEAGYRHAGSLSGASRAVLGAVTPITHSHEQPATEVEEAPPEDYDSILRQMLVDWGIFWDTDHNEADWLAEPIVAAKRSTAIFAPGGTGKSLLALFISACLATGTRIFGRPVEPIDVLYLDYEMTADDLAERLASMGFDDSCDLSRLHYALLPSLPGLDEPEGGKAVVRLAEMVDASLVVIDTFGRAVHGDENDADTVRSWYRWTGIHLKHAGRAFMRVDHAGKDVSKGQRGTSAKNDDVDVVWQMTAREGGAFVLTAKKRRMGWVPMSVDLIMVEDARLHFELAKGHTWPAGTADCAAELDALGIDEKMSGNAAVKALKAAGHGRRTSLVKSAQKYRRERSSTYHFAGEMSTQRPVDNSGTTSGTTPSGDTWEPLREPPVAKPANPQVTCSGTTSGTTRNHPSDASGNHPASRKGAGVPSVLDERPPKREPTAEEIANAEF